MDWICYHLYVICGNIAVMHWCQMKHTCINRLYRHWFRQWLACQLFGTKPSHELILTFCHQILVNKPQQNLNQCTIIFIQGNVCKLSAIFFRPLCVNHQHWNLSFHADNFVFTGGTEGCHNDNLWCYQWHQGGIQITLGFSVSVITVVPVMLMWKIALQVLKVWLSHVEHPVIWLSMPLYCRSCREIR